MLRADGHEVHAFVQRKDALGLRRLRRGGRAWVGASLPARFPVVPELVVSWYYTQRLPQAVLSLAPAVGIHPSLLPRWRGPDPFFWAIYSGDEITGVTAHLLEPEYDTGAILAQRTVAIEPSWNAWTLARRLDPPGLTLLREVTRAFARGAPPAARPQDEARATQAPAPDDDALEIRWTRPAAEIERLVRAAAPFPGAFTEISGKTVVVTRARVTEAPPALAPGEALVRDGIVVVRAADEGIALLSGRLEEDEGSLDAAALAELVRA